MSEKTSSHDFDPIKHGSPSRNDNYPHSKQSYTDHPHDNSHHPLDSWDDLFPAVLKKEQADFHMQLAAVGLSPRDIGDLDENEVRRQLKAAGLSTSQISNLSEAELQIILGGAPKTPQQQEAEDLMKLDAANRFLFDRLMNRQIDAPVAGALDSTGAIRDLIDSVGHVYSNKVHGIISCIYFLQDDLGCDTEEVIEKLSPITKAILSLQNLVTDLRELLNSISYIQSSSLRNSNQPFGTRSNSRSVNPPKYVMLLAEIRDYQLSPDSYQFNHKIDRDQHRAVNSTLREIDKKCKRLLNDKGFNKTLEILIFLLEQSDLLSDLAVEITQVKTNISNNSQVFPGNINRVCDSILATIQSINGHSVKNLRALSISKTV